MRPSWSQYDAQHPKRLLVLHMENTTTSPPEFHLHVASVDGIPFFDLVNSATAGLTAPDSVPEPTLADDLSVDWDVMYGVFIPFSLSASLTDRNRHIATPSASSSRRTASLSRLPP